MGVDGIDAAAGAERLDAAAVTAWLSKGASDDEAAEYARWVAELDGYGADDLSVAPSAPVSADLLTGRLGFTAEDAAETLAGAPDPVEDPELCWLMPRVRGLLVDGMGSLDGPSWRPPGLPFRLGPKARYFYLTMFLSALPATRAYHAERGIPDAISWATFADLGRHVAINRRVSGFAGLEVAFWFGLHFRGLIYDLGRLQFNRHLVEDPPADVPYANDQHVLGCHIPESGPLAPEECQASFERAAAFYAEYFPEETYRYATCRSWLMDDQLGDWLPGDSNIMRFQNRFTLVPGVGMEPSNGSAIGFVFRRQDPVLDELPQRTTLERAIVAHIRAGGHWRSRLGWARLPS